MWCKAPKLLPDGGLERGGTDYVFGVRDVARLILVCLCSYARSLLVGRDFNVTVVLILSAVC